MRGNLKCEAVAERVKRGGGPRVVLAQHRLSDLERPAERHHRVVQPALQGSCILSTHPFMILKDIKK